MTMLDERETEIKDRRKNDESGLNIAAILWTSSAVLWIVLGIIAFAASETTKFKPFYIICALLSVTSILIAIGAWRKRGRLKARDA